VAALQGVLSFDAGRLAYVGQVPIDGVLTVANAQRSATGWMPLLTFRIDGLPRQAAALDFRVLSAGYTQGLSYRSTLIADREGQALFAGAAAGSSSGIAMPPGPSVPSPAPRDLARFAGLRLASDDSAGGGAARVQPSTIRVGDCNLDGAIDALDLIAIALIAVGREDPPTDPSDFRVCDGDGSGSLDVLDVLDVSRSAVGLTPFFGPVGARYMPINTANGHACAIRGTELLCWGNNSAGQLADGTSNQSYAPTSAGVQAVSITGGLSFTCTLNLQRNAYCVGINTVGQIGDGTFVQRGTPTQVVGGHTFSLLAENWAGGQHVCALEPNGSAWCWGAGGSNALGNGSTANRNQPTLVSGGITFRDISTGFFSTCGLSVVGGVYCWGAYFGGYATPTAILGAPPLTSISVGGDFACGLDAVGTAWCWGQDDTRGQHGNGLLIPSPTTPRRVAGQHSFLRISAGNEVACALDHSGQAWCWGTDQFGRLGDGDQVASMVCGVECSPIPVPVVGGRSFAAISTGAFSVCAMDDEGAPWCWGSNSGGQLGVGSSSPLHPHRSPTPVAAFQTVVAGPNHSCGITASQSAYCWGLNTSWQLGNSALVQALAPVAVSGGLAFTSLAVGASHTCGLEASGSAHCWGANPVGQLGNGTTAPALSPEPVAGGHAFTSLVAGTNVTCGLKANGRAYCWGGGSANGTGVSISTSPDSVRTLATFIDLTAGSNHTCGVTAGGQGYCWGTNAVGQLGNGSTASEALPVAVIGGQSFIDVEASSNSTCGRTGAGLAYCWGANQFGQLGDGTFTNRLSPVPVSGGLTFSSVRMGSSHTCGESSGLFWCWGSNDSGQFGDGTTTGSVTPVSAAILPLPMTSLTLGSAFSCGVVGGNGYCWGSNVAGNLGIGTIAQAHSPVPVEW
jgi:alpha-tubulin suppressor-like RCC1 family protein